MSAFRQEWDRRINARELVSREIKAGRMRRQSCAACGDVRADAHHEDYDKPLDVIFLCASHHQKRHSEIRGVRDHGVWLAIGVARPITAKKQAVRMPRTRDARPRTECLRSLASAIVNGASRKLASPVVPSWLTMEGVS